MPPPKQITYKKKNSAPAMGAKKGLNRDLNPGPVTYSSLLFMRKQRTLSKARSDNHTTRPLSQSKITVICLISLLTSDPIPHPRSPEINPYHFLARCVCSWVHDMTRSLIYAVCCMDEVLTSRSDMHGFGTLLFAWAHLCVCGLMSGSAKLLGGYVRDLVKVFLFRRAGGLMGYQV